MSKGNNDLFNKLVEIINKGRKKYGKSYFLTNKEFAEKLGISRQWFQEIYTDDVELEMFLYINEPYKKSILKIAEPVKTVAQIKSMINYPMSVARLRRYLDIIEVPYTETVRDKYMKGLISDKEFNAHREKRKLNAQRVKLEREMNLQASIQKLKEQDKSNIGLMSKREDRSSEFIRKLRGE